MYKSDMLPCANKRISHRPLTLLTYAGICARLYYLLIIDLPEMGNALWLAPLIGAFLSLPNILSAYLLLKRSDMSLSLALQNAFGVRVPCAVIACAFVFEAAAMFIALTESAAYATLYEIPSWSILLLTAVFITIIAARGGNSASGVASVWLLCTPFLYFLVLWSQFGTINFRFLAPFAGPGFRELLRGGILCAFYFCLIPFVMLLDNGQIPTVYHKTASARPQSVLILFLFCALTVCGLCVIHASLYPNIPFLSDNRSLQLDLFLSNGKSNRSIQLPMLLTWYGSLIVSAIFFLYVGGRLFSIAFRSDKACFPLFSGIAAYLLAAFNAAGQNAILRFSMWGAYPALVFWAVILILDSIRAGKKARA